MIHVTEESGLDGTNTSYSFHYIQKNNTIWSLIWTDARRLASSSFNRISLRPMQCPTMPECNQHNIITTIGTMYAVVITML